MPGLYCEECEGNIGEDGWCTDCGEVYYAEADTCQRAGHNGYVVVDGSEGE